MVMDSASNQGSLSAVAAASSLLPVGLETSQPDAESATAAADLRVCIGTLASWQSKTMVSCDAGTHLMLQPHDAKVLAPVSFSRAVECGEPEVLSAAPRSACPQQAAAARARATIDLLCGSSSLQASSLGRAEIQAGYGGLIEKKSPVSYTAGNDPLQSKLAFMQSYLYALLPELKRIHSQPPPFPLKEKLSAVRLAADTSLAVSVTGNSQWSQALLQHLESSSRSKVKVKGKNSGRKSSGLLRRKIYSKILRRSSAQGSAVSVRHRAESRCWQGSNPDACVGIAKDYQPMIRTVVGSRGAAVCKTSPELQRAKPVRLKRSGLSSYGKAFQKSISPRMKMRRKPPAAPCSAALVTKEHIVSLSRLVPGGCSMDVPLLFEETADYIRSLQMQVEALQCLSCLISL